MGRVFRILWSIVKFHIGPIAGHYVIEIEGFFFFNTCLVVTPWNSSVFYVMVEYPLLYILEIIIQNYLASYCWDKMFRILWKMVKSELYVYASV